MVRRKPKRTRRKLYADVPSEKAIIDWANAPGKPDEVSEAISWIQGIIGDNEWAFNTGINQAYSNQMRAWFRLKPNTKYIEGNNPRSEKLSVKNTKQHHNTKNWKGAMFFDEYSGGAGHWFYACRAKDVPNWFLQTDLFISGHFVKSWKALRGLARTTDKIVKFGHTGNEKTREPGNYLQPYATNQWCQAYAALFALAFNDPRGDSKWSLALKQLRCKNQDEADAKATHNQGIVDATEEIVIPAWEFDEPQTLPRSVLASELMCSDVFSSNFSVMRDIIPELLSLDKKLSKKDSKYYVKIINDYLMHGSEALMNCTFDR